MHGLTPPFFPIVIISFLIQYFTQQFFAEFFQSKTFTTFNLNVGFQNRGFLVHLERLHLA